MTAPDQPDPEHEEWIEANSSMYEFVRAAMRYADQLATRREREACAKMADPAALLRECKAVIVAEFGHDMPAEHFDLMDRIDAFLSAQPAEAPKGRWVPLEPTEEWAERFCDLVNWHPDGTQNSFVEGQLHSVTFLELAKGYIRSMLAAAKER